MDADIYSLLMGDEPTAQEQARAMAAALRRQSAAAQLGMLTGDRVLGQFGQAQMADASKGQQMMAEMMGNRLSRALAARKEAAKLAEDDPASRQNVEYRKQLAALYPQQFAALPPEVRDQLTAESAQKGAQRAWEAEANRQAGFGRVGLVNDSMMQMMMHKQREADEKEQRTAAKGTVVPGYDVAPEAAPTSEDAKKVKTASASAERMRGLVSELKALHAKKGTELFGADAERMQQLATAIQIEAKTLAELGALSGPDMALMQKLSGTDPTSVWANVKGAVGMDNTQQALEQIGDWVGNAEGSTAKAYGYQKKAAPVASAGEERRAIGGKNYVKRNGKWFEE